MGQASQTQNAYFHGDLPPLREIRTPSSSTPRGGKLDCSPGHSSSSAVLLEAVDWVNSVQGPPNFRQQAFRVRQISGTVQKRIRRSSQKLQLVAYQRSSSTRCLILLNVGVSPRTHLN